MNNKTTELRTSILETIQNLNISTHLFVDCKKFLDCLNWYKIKNIHQNLNDFLQHIMDVNNAIVIREQKESEQKKSDSECTSGDNNVDRGEILRNIHALRGYFLLTITEFALGSSLRLEISKVDAKKKPRLAVSMK